MKPPMSRNRPWRLVQPRSENMIRKEKLEIHMLHTSELFRNLSCLVPLPEGPESDHFWRDQYPENDIQFGYQDA